MTPDERAVLESQPITSEWLRTYYDALEQELYVSRENRVRYEQAVRTFFGIEDGWMDQAPKGDANGSRADVPAPPDRAEE